MSTVLVALLHLAMIAIGAAWGAQRTWKACTQATGFLAMTKRLNQKGVEAEVQAWKRVAMDGARYDLKTGKTRSGFGEPWEDVR